MYKSHVFNVFLVICYLFFKASQTILFDRKITDDIFAAVGHFLVGRYDAIAAAN